MANKTFRDFIRLFDGNVAAAAEGIGVTRQTVYNWQKQHLLTDEAMMRIRHWFLETRREVPPEWMPK